MANEINNENVMADALQQVNPSPDVSPVATPQPQRKTVVGGVPLYFPADMSEEEVRTRVNEFRNSPEFERYIDKESGAPYVIRMVVGGAINADEKLATLRNYYPDAAPYKEDNFIYTDPISKRYTVYNPEGADIGDAFSITREVVQGGVSTLGAKIGFLSPLPGGTYLGAGVGNYIGGQAFDLLTMLAGRRVYDKDAPEAVTEAVLDIGFGAAGEKAGRVVFPMLHRMLGGGSQFAQDTLAAFARANVTPPATAVSPVMAQVGSGVQATPIASGILRRKSEVVIKAVAALADDITSRFGTPQTRQGLGEVVQEAAKRINGDVARRMNELEAPIIRAMGDDNLVDFVHLRAKQAELQELINQGPAFAKMYREAVQWVDDVLATTNPTYQTVKTLKSNLGVIAFGKPGNAIEAKLLKELQDVYFKMSKDLVDTAARKIPEVAKDVARYNRYYSLYANSSKEFFKKMAAYDTPQTIYNTVINQSRGGDVILKRLKKNFTPEEWGDVAATLLNDLGMAPPSRQSAAGNVWSASDFLTNWNKLSDEAKNVMFGSVRHQSTREALDLLAKQTEALKMVQNHVNGSKTTQTLVTNLVFGALGFGAADVGGAGSTAILAAGGYIGVGSITAKTLLTNDKFVRWLATPISENATEAQIAAHFARLSAIAAENEFIQPHINRLVGAMRAYTQPTAGDMIIMEGREQ